MKYLDTVVARKTRDLAWIVMYHLSQRSNAVIGRQASLYSIYCK